MKPAPPLKDYFRPVTPADTLNLFQALFDSSQISADLALALLKIIHRDLSAEKTRDRSVYKRYSRAIQALRYHKAEWLEQIVMAWGKSPAAKDPEWLLDGHIK